MKPGKCSDGAGVSVAVSHPFDAGSIPPAPQSSLDELLSLSECLRGRKNVLTNTFAYFAEHNFKYDMEIHYEKVKISNDQLYFASTTTLHSGFHFTREFTDYNGYVIETGIRYHAREHK